MLEQYKNVLRTYNHPMLYALLVPSLYFSFMLIVDAQRSKPGVPSPTSVPEFLILTFLLAFSVGVLLGAHIPSVFSPARARLIPGFARAHFSVAAALTALVALAAIGLGKALTLGSASALGEAGIAVAFVLLSLSYFWGWIPAPLTSVLYAFVFIAIQYTPVGAAIGVLGRAIVLEGRWSVILPLILFDCIGAIAIVQRARRVHEESPEILRTAWLADLQSGRAMPRMTSDRIERLQAACLLAPDVRSRLRLDFRMSFLPTPRNIAKYIAILIAVGWAIELGIRILGRGSFSHAGYGMLALFLLSVLGAIPFLTDWRKRRLQSLLLLPIKRHDLITDLGRALVSTYLYHGIAVAAAAWVLESAPTPLDFRGPASAWPILATCCLQFPLLGLSTLVAVSSYRVVLVLLALALLQTVGSGLGMIGLGYSVEVSIVATAIGGALLWLSYRLWLRVETQ